LRPVSAGMEKGVRLMFFLYTGLILAGITFFAIVGLTHG
jgi:hypothetical protein